MTELTVDVEGKAVEWSTVDVDCKGLVAEVIADVLINTDFGVVCLVELTNGVVDSKGVGTEIVTLEYFETKMVHVRSMEKFQ